MPSLLLYIISLGEIYIMEDHEKITAANKENFYRALLIKLEALISDERDSLANLANSSALLFENMDDINWAGFYINRNNELVLGPFQGRIACTRIKMGKGVCGNAVLKQEVQVVKNVHEFTGHIACDSATNSEIVVPVIIDGCVKAVLDIDSPVFERFDETDARNLQKFVDKLSKYVDWSVF